MVLPVYRADLSLVFPELPSKQQTTHRAERPLSAMCMMGAYLLAGKKFEGSLAQLTPQQLVKELQDVADELGLPLERMLKFSESLLRDPEDYGEVSDTPEDLVGPALHLHQYQRRTASWAARRQGTVLALGMGVGKTATATAAAITAVKRKACSPSRCFIVAPVNAIPTWDDYIKDLRRAFELVRVVSVDSLHHLQALDAYEGGALIIDEAHKCKNDDSDRTGYAHSVRSRFDWAVCLTGSLLHTGCDGIRSVLDLACPGLSRFIDKWHFGEYLNAIVTKKIDGLGFRKKIVIPPDTSRPKLVHYLGRAVKSLSYESEEVAAEVQVPGQTKTLEDTWPKPAWADALKDENGETIPYLWGCEVPWDEYAAALALAIMDENKKWLPGEVLQALGQDWTYEEAAAQLPQRLKLDPENDTLIALMKRVGIPSASALFWEMRVDGRYGRVIQKVKIGDPARIVYRFAYPPGHDDLNPAPGPKIHWLDQWFTANPGEPIVCGVVSSKTLRLCEDLVNRRGITYDIIDGGVPAKKRKSIVKEFQSGGIQALLVQQVAGSESINLTRAATSLLVDHDTSPIVYAQYLARTCRQGQKRECEHYDLSFNGLQTLRIHALRRGVEFDTEARKELEAVYGRISDVSPSDSTGGSDFEFT